MRHLVILICLQLTGCAGMEGFTDRHPYVVPAASIVVLTVGGVLVARSLAHGNAVQVKRNPSAFCNGGNYTECVK